MQVYELSARYDSRASFYGKARVEEVNEYDKRLISYTTHVASITTERGVKKAQVFGTYSQTTLRHIKEFLAQNGFTANNSKQIMADYGTK